MNMGKNHICEIGREDFVKKWQEVENAVVSEIGVNDIAVKLMGLMGCMWAVNALFPEGETRVVFDRETLLDSLTEATYKAAHGKNLSPDAGFAMILHLGVISAKLCTLLFPDDDGKEAEA